jgi:hypothetical protein
MKGTNQQTYWNVMTVVNEQTNENELTPAPQRPICSFNFSWRPVLHVLVLSVFGGSWWNPFEDADWDRYLHTVDNLWFREGSCRGGNTRVSN